jgi:hypothetical protein
MKFNINGKEVDIVVNGEVQTEAAKKAKLSDQGLTQDEVVRKAKEELDKKEE